MKNNMLVKAIGLYVAGFGICALSIFLSLYWRQNEIAISPIIRHFVGGLPWLSVAVVIVTWRARELAKIYPLAFVFGVGTPFVLLFLRGLV